ncbi:MAG: helix-turn-helix domain-containing protein [Pseudomonadota bacterium]
MTEWVGRIILGKEWVLYVGEGGRTPMHRHLAHKVVIGLDAPVEITKAQTGPRFKRLHVVRPGELHEVGAANTRVGLLFVDAGTFRHTVVPTPGTFKALMALFKQLDAGDTAVLDSLLQVLTISTQQAVDPRVAAVVDQLRSPVDTSLVGIAAGIGLSTGRLSHLFSSHIGASPARYRRWRRLRVALEWLGRGERIVDAALAAGFSDEAHLNRTCVEMIGITPGVFRANQVVSLASSASISPMQ